MLIQAAYYKTLGDRPRAVQLQARDGQLQLSGDGLERSVPLEAIEVAVPAGLAPRRLVFASGGFCELAEEAQLEYLLTALRQRQGLRRRLQRTVVLALSLSLVGIGLVMAAYAYLLPWAAAQAAGQLPPAMSLAFADRILSDLDGRVLLPSRLPAARRVRLLHAFRNLQRGSGGVAPGQLLFRSSAQLGSGALALPDGTVVVLDAFLQDLESDEAVLALLAHELGHVEGRHALRALMRQHPAALIAGWWFGDWRRLLKVLPAAAPRLRFTREAEAEAEAYAQALLARQGIAAERLTEARERLALATSGGGTYLAAHPAGSSEIEAWRGRTGAARNR